MVRKVNQTSSQGRSRFMPYWTFPRRHSGFAVVRHQGSLTMGTARGHGSRDEAQRFRLRDSVRKWFSLCVYNRIYSCRILHIAFAVGL
jgi:hypothetical protein